MATYRIIYDIPDDFTVEDIQANHAGDAADYAIHQAAALYPACEDIAVFALDSFYSPVPA